MKWSRKRLKINRIYLPLQRSRSSSFPIQWRPHRSEIRSRLLAVVDVLRPPAKPSSNSTHRRRRRHAGAFSAAFHGHPSSPAAETIAPLRLFHTEPQPLPPAPPPSSPPPRWLASPTSTGRGAPPPTRRRRRIPAGRASAPRASMRHLLFYALTAPRSKPSLALPSSIIIILHQIPDPNKKQQQQQSRRRRRKEGIESWGCACESSRSCALLFFLLWASSFAMAVAKWSFGCA